MFMLFFTSRCTKPSDFEMYYDLRLWSFLLWIYFFFNSSYLKKPILSKFYAFFHKVDNSLTKMLDYNEMIIHRVTSGSQDMKEKYNV